MSSNDKISNESLERERERREIEKLIKEGHCSTVKICYFLLRKNPNKFLKISELMDLVKKTYPEFIQNRLQANLEWSIKNGKEPRLKTEKDVFQQMTSELFSGNFHSKTGISKTKDSSGYVVFKYEPSTETNITTKNATKNVITKTLHQSVQTSNDKTNCDDQSRKNEEKNYNKRNNDNCHEKHRREEDYYQDICNILFEKEIIYPKIIDALKSSNKYGRGSAEWLHPDIVGVKDTIKDFKSNVKEISDDKKRLEIYSFEVKKDLSMSNLKQYFFQALSNSSWANYGYLVFVEEINEQDKRLMEELQTLCSSYNIGVIKINVETKSMKTLFYANKRELNWKMINRIAEENNSDFNKFLKNISTFYKTQELEEFHYDIDVD